MPSPHQDIVHLADTNVLSELLKLQPNPGVVGWATGMSRIAVSAVTVEEICYGLSWKPNEQLARWFDSLLNSTCTVLPVTEEIARRAGSLRGALRAKGRTRSQADMMIAATASVHGLTLVSRNGADFDGCGVTILNPFV